MPQEEVRSAHCTKGPRWEGRAANAPTASALPAFAFVIVGYGVLYWGLEAGHLFIVYVF